jgi:tRNA (adenine57-N1/adenine58-N1)-methyltransferase
MSDIPIFDSSPDPTEGAANSTSPLPGTTIAAGDIVLFIGSDRKNYVRAAKPGDRLVTHLGNIEFDGVIGIEYGSRVRTHLGSLFYVLQPGVEDLLAHARHDTTTIQPKDLGPIALRLKIQAGTRVIEAGTGSGALTTYLAMLVGETGRVYSYDRKAANMDTARRNLVRAGVVDRVTFVLRDITEGFDQTGVDALFLDIRNPDELLDQAHAALRGGGFFGALVPTVNQVIDLTSKMFKGPWFQVEVEEFWQRSYKVVPARLRPQDRMVGHTGYLVFARAIIRQAGEGEPVEPTAEIETDVPDDS